MKKPFSLLLATALALVSAADQGKVITVGYYSEPGLMNGAAEGAVKSGYAYEYLQEMASHAGWRFRYVYGTFKELYDRLRANEIDLLPYITRTEAREKEVLFPEMEMGSEQFFLAAKDGEPLDESLRGLQGRKVGTNRAAFHLEPFSELLKEKGVTCELVVSTNPHDRWNALLDGSIDFSIETSTVIQDVPLKAVYPFGRNYPYYLAVAPGKPDVLAELNAAQRRTQEVRPAFLHGLRLKYFRGIPLFRMLPEESTAWLKTHPVIRIGSYDRQAPYIYADSDGRVVGVMPDGVKLMLEGVGVTQPVEWKLYPGRAEAIEALAAGEIDLVNPYYHNYADAEQDGVIISAPVYDSKFGVLYRGDYDRDTLAVVATPSQRLGIRYMRDNYPESRCVGCRDGADGIMKLGNGEVNGVVMYLPILQRLAEESDGDFNIKVLSSSCAVCFAALPRNAALISLVNKAIPYVSAVAQNEIENRYAIAESTQIGFRRFFRQHAIWFHSFLAGLLLVLLAVVLLWLRTARERERRHIAEEASRAKSEFLFNMSHDIRTPIHVITGFADIAAETPGDREKVGDCVDKIRKAGDLLNSLLNSILDLSRIEVGKVKIVESPGDVMSAFDSLNSTMAEVAKENGIELSFGFGEIRDRYVYADFEKCNRIFMNILSNAVKYTGRGGRVKVRCEQVSGNRQLPATNCQLYRYTFEDNGIGMAPEFVERLYERFSREQNTTMSGVAGIGLGMSICKAFVDMMGGTIECRSKQGEGTVFVVELPFRVRAAEEVKTPATDAPVSFAGRRLLLVDDCAINILVVCHYLKQWGIEFDKAENGSVAVAKVCGEKEGKPYDLILMDLQMPVMDGYAAARAIREWERSTSAPHVPIIAWSANAFEEDRERSLAAGMDDHVVKGAKPDAFHEVLARYLTRS